MGKRSAVARAAGSFDLRGRTAKCAWLVDVRGKDVLDVGCSFGWFARHALQREARSMTGVDEDEAALEVARTFARGARFLHSSALELPFDPESFDVVVAYDVIEHLPSGTEAQALSEMKRVLRRRGCLGLSTPNRTRLATLSDPAFYLGHRHYRPADLRQLVSAAGFSVEHLESGGRLFDQADLLLYYFWRHVFRRERHPFGFVRQRADREWRREDERGNTLLLVARPVGPDGTR